jgi:hypothetical protein
MDEKPAPNESPKKKASRPEAKAPLIPASGPSSREPRRQPLAKGNKKELRKQARELHEVDWLAPAGSEREKQFLKSWEKRGGPSTKELALIKEWVHNPDQSAKRNTLFWQAAKKSVLGPVVYGTAIERHRALDDKEWLVACFTAQGMKQEKIAELTHLGERMVDNVIRILKDKIIQELGCDIESVDLPQIACWFFGL